MMKRKEKQLKKRMIRMKMMAINQTDGEGIIASYEPDIEGAVEYFYEEGLNEEGIDQLIEEIGIEEFVNFVDESAVDLNEERAARKASVRAKKYDVVKKEVDKADAARRKAKKGEYAPSYAKKETDVTVYDDKPSAKKKAPVKKAVVKKAPVKKSKKDYDGDKKLETPKQEHRGVRNKKITKAVAKVKKTQPKKKATKQGLGDKIRTAYKAGVKRHRKATQGARVFGKGFAAGAKKAVKFAKDVKKVVSEEELLERQKTNQGERQSQEAGRSNYGKASVRNKRKFGTEGEPLVGKAAIFRQEGDRGDLIDKRREEHKAKRGVKTKGVTEAKVDTGKSPEEKEKVRNVRKFGVSHNVAGHGKLRRALHRSNRGDKKIPGDKSQYVETEAYRVLAKDKTDLGRPAAFSYKDEKDAKKFADSIKSKGGKATVQKEGVMDIVRKYRKKQKSEKKPSMDPTTKKLHKWRKDKEHSEREKYVSPFRPIDYD